MLSKKKTILFAAAAVILAAVTAVTAVSALGGNVLELAGSTTLGPVVIAAAPAFNTAGTGATIDTAGIIQNSSGAGIGELGNPTATPPVPQTIDIAMASRALKSTEAALDTQTKAAVDAVVIMVSKTLTPTDITQLTKQQIAGIYQGVYALANNSGDPATGSGSQNEYWDAAAVTVPSAGILGDDGHSYLAGVYFPALPGYADYTAAGGTSAGGVVSNSDHVQINVLARNLNSGTRGFLGDTVAHGGCNFLAAPSGDSDPVMLDTNDYQFANYYPLEEELIGPDSNPASDTNREASATAMASAIQNATNSVIGYAGLGYDTGSNIRDIAVEDDLTSTGAWTGSPADPTYYLPTNINVYSYHYHLSRYLYLDTRTTNTTTYDTDFINWFTTLDGGGQDTTVQQHELRLVPDEDINNDGVVNIYDLVQFGNDWGKTDTNLTGTSHIRSDILRQGSVNIYDLVDLGNWWGVQIQTLP